MSKSNISEGLSPLYDHQHSHMYNDSDEDRTLAGTPLGELPDYSSYKNTGRGLASAARITKDGRITISLDLKQTGLPDLPKDWANNVREFGVDPALLDVTDGGLREDGKIPKLNIVIMIVGSRGDVQPYVAFGLELARHGHRVRIATHGNFKDFVLGVNDGAGGLEFFDIGGDPHELMSYMVRNPGLMPGFESLTNGDIGRKRKTMRQILSGCWQSCISQDPQSGRKFVADAIIANPPSFAHIHIAEALGIPLLMSFTMPWCPTTSFPHPLVNVSESNAERGVTNYLSYALAEIMTWKGLGDLINKFRVNTLGLEALTIRSGPGVVDRVKVPWTYCFSPELVPKPEDWKNHIDVVGFYFLDLAKSYKPPNDLDAFLKAGPPPIYIGFGSVVVEDPEGLTTLIFKATEQAGVRALVSAGWGGLGGSIRVPPHIFILGNVPHDWLFDKVSAVCHHGGAGTTAIGLRLGKPTIIVPFFGDQPFWGQMVHKAGAGPKPIRKDELTVEKLRDGIKFCQTEGAKRSAELLGKDIRHQNGVEAGVQSFHRHLPVLNMRCDILPDRLAVWWDSQRCLRLSAFAAQVLSEAKLIDIGKLELHRPKEYDTHSEASDPFSGGMIEIFRTITNFNTGITQLFHSPVKGVINTTTAIPRGVVRILDQVYEGLHNTPSLYGSTIRKTERVKDFKSGLRQGGMDLFHGYYDGITGLYTEPAEGLKKEGAVGMLKGHARSFVNATMKPAAGAVGLVVHPMRGAWMSLRKLTANLSFETDIRVTRLSQGREEAYNDSPSLDVEKQKVLDNFKIAIKKTNIATRRQTLAEQVIKYIESGGSGSVIPDTSSISNRPEEPSKPPPLPPRRAPPKLSHPLPQSSSISEVTTLSDSPGALTEADEASLATKLQEAASLYSGGSHASKDFEEAQSRRLQQQEDEEEELGWNSEDEKLFEQQIRQAIEMSLSEQGPLPPQEG